MRFGIGCMNDLLLVLTEKMAKLLNNADKTTSYAGSKILKQFNEATFGRQMNILKAHYNGADISYTKMSHLVAERNYFIHDYQTKKHKSSDAKRLYDLIKLIKTVTGQLNNANQRVTKQNKTAQNVGKNALRNAIIAAARNCTVYDGAYAKISDIGLYLANNGYTYEGGLEDTIRGFGWETYYDEGRETVKYVKIIEVK
jgi:hypothetical protein